ncbi:TPA: GlyGly-CTERM sorting domain-containing protein [Vibrio vulnificus]|nr:GlyGly-CTERM sorting domain-containing protein [Vibrio vulnificus]
MMKNVKMKYLMLALMSWQLEASQVTEIDVGVVIDDRLISSYGRERLDNEIRDGISLSNITLTPLNYQRTVRMVRESTDERVANETSGHKGAGGGHAVACEVIKEPGFEHFDNVIFLVPETGNLGSTGVGASCWDRDYAQQVVVIAVDNVVRSKMKLSQVLAHELGHVDGMKHHHADELFNQTGEVTLMISDLRKGSLNPEKLITDGDKEMMRQAEAVADVFPKSFSHPTSPAKLIGEASFKEESVSVSSEFRSLLFEVTLDTPKSEDVSLEFFTRSGSAKANQDYYENIHRLVILAGQTEASVGVELIDDAVRMEDKSFSVGLRYGDKVSATGEIEINLSANAPPTLPDVDSGDKSDSGSSGGSLGWLGLFWLLAIAYRRH